MSPTKEQMARASFFERCLAAIKMAGLSRGQFCRVIGWPREWLDSEFYYHRDIILVAETLHVDARLLVTGEVSADGKKNIEFILQSKLAARDIEKMVSLFEMFQEGETASGQCRYCFGIDRVWANKQQTICKPCVKLDELEDAA